MEIHNNLVKLAWTRLPWWRRTLCLFGFCDPWYWIAWSARQHEDTHELSRWLHKAINEGVPITAINMKKKDSRP